MPGWGASPPARRCAAWASAVRRSSIDAPGLRPDLVGGQDPLGLAIAAERATRVRAAVAALRRAVSRDRRPALLRRAVAGRDRRADRSAAGHRQDASPSRPGQVARCHGRRGHGMNGRARSVRARADWPRGWRASTRELDAFADETRLAPPADLADRIMAAVADEPVPTPPVTFLHAVGALALVDAWRAWRLNLRVALGPGPAPGRLRLQALAVVVVAALLVGIGGSTVAVGAARLVQGLVTPSVTDLDATPDPSGLEVSPAADDRRPRSRRPADVARTTAPSRRRAPSLARAKAPGESSEPAESDEQSSGGRWRQRSHAAADQDAHARPRRRSRTTPRIPTRRDDSHETATPKPQPTSGGSGIRRLGPGSARVRLLTAERPARRPRPRSGAPRRRLTRGCRLGA